MNMIKALDTWSPRFCGTQFVLYARFRHELQPTFLASPKDMDSMSGLSINRGENTIPMSNTMSIINPEDASSPA